MKRYIIYLIILLTTIVACKSKSEKMQCLSYVNKICTNFKIPDNYINVTNLELIEKYVDYDSIMDLNYKQLQFSLIKYLSNADTLVKIYLDTLSYNILYMNEAPYLPLNEDYMSIIIDSYKQIYTSEEFNAEKVTWQEKNIKDGDLYRYMKISMKVRGKDDLIVYHTFYFIRLYDYKISLFIRIEHTELEDDLEDQIKKIRISIPS